MKGVLAGPSPYGRAAAPVAEAPICGIVPVCVTLEGQQETMRQSRAPEGRSRQSNRTPGRIILTERSAHDAEEEDSGQATRMGQVRGSGLIGVAGRLGVCPPRSVKY